MPKVGHRCVKRSLAVALTASALFASGAAEAQSTVSVVDPNMVYESLYTGNGIVSLAFGPGGRLYATEKQGRLLLFRPNGTGGFLAPIVLLDNVSQTEWQGESGMLGLVLDPDMATNRYIYVLYTSLTDQRVIRLTTDSTYEALVPNSTTTIISGLPRQAYYHKAGQLAFQPNDPNSLWIAIGDDSSPSSAQDLAFYNGKILRINKTNGQGLADNPYYAGDLNAVRARIWAIGLRNPFRFAFHPNVPVSNAIYVSENGDNTDRMSFVRRGSNGSWTWTGDSGGFLNPPDTNFKVLVTPTPFLIGIGLVRGGYFSDPAAPGSDALYLANGRTSGGNISRWRLTGTNLDQLTPFPGDGGVAFATGVMAVDLKFGPDGALYYSETTGGQALGTGRIARFRRVGGVAPVASFTASPTSGTAPLAVAFTDRSTDADGTITARLWDFGDGTSSADANPSHTYANAGTYTVTLTVTDNSGLTNSTFSTVSAVQGLTIRLTGRVYDGRDLLNSGLPVATTLRLYQSDGATPLAFSGGAGTNGNAIGVAIGGTFDTTFTVSLTGSSVVVSAGEQTSPYETQYIGFTVPAGATSLTQTLNFRLSDTAIRGRVLDTRGAAALTDVGVASGTASNRYAISGGRDFLATSGITASGVNHRTNSDALGYFYIPIRTGTAGGTFFLDIARDTNATLYLPNTVSAVVAADALVLQNITAGLVNGGQSCDSLSAVASVATDYESMVQPIFSAQCTGCHSATGSANASLDLVSGTSYAELVNMASLEVPGRNLVTPSAPASSFLTEKVGCASPQVGDRMRPTDAMTLADQARIRDWIAQGARRSPSDPDTTTPTLANGTPTTVTLGTSGDVYYKVYVYPGATSFTAVVDGPNCTTQPCAFETDLYTRRGARPTDTIYDCRPYAVGPDETCSTTSVIESWMYVRVRARSGSGTVTLTVTQDGTGAYTANGAPTASFTTSTSGLTATLNGSASTDPNGDALIYQWTYGDGTTGEGASVTKTYAAAGTYNVSLTVRDPRGATGTQTQAVTVTAPVTDPDPTTPTLTNNQTVSLTLGSNSSEYRKINVPAGRTTFTVRTTGPNCNSTSCPFNADLYVRLGSRPTNTQYTCRAANLTNAETCTINSPTAGWWYMRVRAVRGSGTISLTPSY